MLNIGALTLGDAPCVAIALQEAIPPAEIRAAAPGPVLLELRLDALADCTPPGLCAFAAAYPDFPLLATIRHAGEGGGWRGDEPARLAAYQAVLPLVHAVDVELESGEITGAVVDAARAAGRVTIGSFHDFAATPESSRLEAIHARGRAVGVDIVKVAARCNSAADLRRLARFTLDHEHEGVIVVGMGGHGLASRIFFPLLGSLVTYTFLGAPSAPGQLNCADTLKYLGVFHPGAHQCSLDSSL